MKRSLLSLALGLSCLLAGCAASGGAAGSPGSEKDATPPLPEEVASFLQGDPGLVVVADVFHESTYGGGYIYAFRTRSVLAGDGALVSIFGRPVDHPGVWAWFTAPPSGIVTNEGGLGWSDEPEPMVLVFAPPADMTHGIPTVDPAPGTGMGSFVGAGLVTPDERWLGLTNFGRIDVKLADEHWPHTAPE